MPEHTDHQHFDYTTIQLFDLVVDVEKYPEFLPWVKAVRITERHESYFLAEMVVSFKHITEKYTSKVTPTQPADESEPGAIDVELVDGPFHHLVNNWKFIPSDNGCEVSFHVDFAFKNIILDKLIGTLFNRATYKMIAAFSERAESLYAAKN